ITDQIKSNFADCARYRPGCVGQKSTVSNSRRQKWRHRQFCTLWKSSRGKSAVPASVCRAQQILARGFLFAGDFKFAFEPGENPMTRVGQALANAQGGVVFSSALTMIHNLNLLAVMEGPKRSMTQIARATLLGINPAARENVVGARSGI